jgi:hypothetical protein
MRTLEEAFGLAINECVKQGTRGLIILLIIGSLIFFRFILPQLIRNYKTYGTWYIPENIGKGEINLE